MPSRTTATTPAAKQFRTVLQPLQVVSIHAITPPSGVQTNNATSHIKLHNQGTVRFRVTFDQAPQSMPSFGFRFSFASVLDGSLVRVATNPAQFEFNASLTIPTGMNVYQSPEGALVGLTDAITFTDATVTFATGVGQMFAAGPNNQ